LSAVSVSHFTRSKIYLSFNWTGGPNEDMMLLLINSQHSNDSNNILYIIIKTKQTISKLITFHLPYASLRIRSVSGVPIATDRSTCRL